jgi:trans-2,3-dihydro-3-hydroxyanthranilate isomerase
VIREPYAEESAAETVLDLPVGRVPVRPELRDGRETLWMTQQPPTFGEELPRPAVAAAV